LDELWIDVYLQLDKHAVKLPVYECIYMRCKCLFISSCVT